MSTELLQAIQKLLTEISSLLTSISLLLSNPPTSQVQPAPIGEESFGAPIVQEVLVSPRVNDFVPPHN